MGKLYKKIVFVMLYSLVTFATCVLAKDFDEDFVRPPFTDSRTLFEDGLQGPVKSVTTYCDRCDPVFDGGLRKVDYREYDKQGMIQLSMLYRGNTYYSYVDGKVCEEGRFDPNSGVRKPQRYYSYIGGKVSEEGGFQPDSEVRKPIVRYQYIQLPNDIEIVNQFREDILEKKGDLIHSKYTKKKNGLLVEKINMDSAGLPESIYSYEYMPENKIKITITNLQMNINTTTTQIYATDKIYRIIETVGMGRMKDPDQPNDFIKYSYDENFQLVEKAKQSYLKGQLEDKFSYVRTYEILKKDPFGNWIERRVSSGRPEYETREFVYYD